MSKFIKYALAVATLLIACATFAFAADGEPVVATVNGRPYTSLSSALDTARPGELVTVVSSTEFSGYTIIPEGVRFILPRGITLSTSSGTLISKGYTSLYGQLVRTGTSSTAGLFLLDKGQTNIYGSLVSTSNTGGAITSTAGASSDAVLNFFGGRVIGFNSSIRASNASFNIFSGYFDPAPVLGSSVKLAGGASLSGNVVSWGGLYELGQIVSESFSWIGLFCAAIVANKLLLIFIIFVFGFVGLGLIKRIINN